MSTSGEDSQWPKKRNVRTSPLKSASFPCTENTRQPMNSTDDTSRATGTGDGWNDDSNDKKPFANDEAGKPDTGSDGTWRSGGSGLYIPKRLIVTVLLGMGMLLIYAMRTNVGVLVVMILDERAIDKLDSVDVILNAPRVTWDARHVGLLHSVFYIGFIATQIPAAFGTMMWPSHRLYGGCILVSALLNLLLPVCIENGEYEITCIIRTCQGLAEGCLYPACYGVLRHWTAPCERSRQVSAVLSCCYAGAIVGFPIAGVITHYLHWQYIFYVFGGLCIMWWLLWACLAYEKPSHHAHISESEFDFMTTSQGDDVIDYENLKIPWKPILTSLPVVAICLCHFVRNWVLGLMLTNEPLYLSKFGFNIAEAGALASLPHVAKVVMSFVSGCVADALLSRKYLTTTVVRKILVGVGFGLESVGFLILTALSDGTAVIIVLTMSVGVFGLTTSGWSVNHYDLSTRYASALVAVTSTFGSIGAIIVPIATGQLTVEQDLAGWAHVFYLTAGIILLAAIFYLIFGSGESQRWSNPPANFCLIQKIDPLARKPYKALAIQNSPPCQTGYTPASKNIAVLASQSDTILPSFANGVRSEDIDRKMNALDKQTAVDDRGKMESTSFSNDKPNSFDDANGRGQSFASKDRPSNEGDVRPESGSMLDKSKMSNSDERECYVNNFDALSGDFDTRLLAGDRQLNSATDTVEDSTIVNTCHQVEESSILKCRIEQPRVGMAMQKSLSEEKCNERNLNTEPCATDVEMKTLGSDTPKKGMQCSEDVKVAGHNAHGDSNKDGDFTESLALRSDIDFDLNEQLIS